MRYVYDDGGREAAGYMGKTGDCVTRAVAIASGMPYDTVYQRLALGNERQRHTRRSSAHSGKRTASHGIRVQRKWFKDYMAELGFVASDDEDRAGLPHPPELRGAASWAPRGVDSQALRGGDRRHPARHVRLQRTAHHVVLVGLARSSEGRQTASRWRILPFSGALRLRLLREGSMSYCDNLDGPCACGAWHKSDGPAWQQAKGVQAIEPKDDPLEDTIEIPILTEAVQ